MAKQRSAEPYPWFFPHDDLKTVRCRITSARVMQSIQRKEWAGEHEMFVALHFFAYRFSRSRSRGSDKRIVAMGYWRQLREYLVRLHSPIVYRLMMRFSTNTTVDFDDIQSDGMLSLARAVELYNPWKGYRFSTYAFNAVGRALSRRVRRSLRYRQVFPCSLDDHIEAPRNERGSVDPDEEGALSRALGENQAQLSDIEREVIRCRFLLGGEDRMTFEEIGEAHGKSKERIRQIQQCALDKLRWTIRADLINRGAS